MTTDPDTLAKLSPAGRIEALRRRMASIPARTDGSAAPAVPTERAEARFETRPETITESTTSVLEVPSAIATLLPSLGLNRPDFRSYGEVCPAGAGWADSRSA